MQRRLVITWVLLIASSASADPPIRRPKSPAALEHLDKAGKLYSIRSFEEAAAEYKQGALIEAAPVFDYDLGQCYRQLHKYQDAIWYYQRFIKASPDTPDYDENAQKLITQMQAELDQRAMTAPPTEPATSSPTKPTPIVAASTTSTTTIAAPEPEHWYADGFGWGLAGAGLVGAGVATALLLDASSLNDQANHTADQQEASSLHDSAGTRSLLGTVIMVGGAGLIVTGAIKLAIHPSAPDHSTTAWNLGLSPSGLFVFGRF
jgi:tetratricopeptide (TPR) repeat protein